MTVADLIDMLSEMPQDAQCVVFIDEEGADPVSARYELGVVEIDCRVDDSLLRD